MDEYVHLPCGEDGLTPAASLGQLTKLPHHSLFGHFVSNAYPDLPAASEAMGEVLRLASLPDPEVCLNVAENAMAGLVALFAENVKEPIDYRPKFYF